MAIWNRTSGTELIWASRVPGQIERHLVLLEVAYPGSSKMPLQLPVSGVLYDLLPPACLCCAWSWGFLDVAGHGPATPPTLTGGQWPLGVHIKHKRLVQPQCQSASLAGNKHVLIKTKHFQTGVSCWNFLAAPKAVVIMETLTAFFLFNGCAKHIQ